MSNPSTTSSHLNFSCHCAAITLTIPSVPPPAYINECMCSICRRYGAAWIYYPVNAVQITKKGPTKCYVWGDRSCEFTWCEGCGCLVYWYPIGREGEEEVEGRRIGVNSRCVDKVEDLRFVERRVTWEDALTVKEGVYDAEGPVREQDQKR